MHGAVLAVDRHQLGSGSGPQRLHHRRAGDQALFVGQGQALARLQRADRDRQPGEPDDAVDDDVGVVGQIGQVGDDFGERQRPPATSARRRSSATATTFGRNSLAWAMSTSIDEPTPRATTSYRPGSARMTSSVCTPIDPDEPAMATRTVT